MKVKIFGAGSIGNHLSHAARSLGWSVDLVDPDKKALIRTQTEIYPGRYGSFDPAIGLYESKDAPSGGYDLICIGTPPDSHLPLALMALKEKPRAILIEKPACGPDLEGAQELFEQANKLGIAVFIGYDHVVGQASRLVGELLGSGKTAPHVTIDVEFREYWGGIFAAHPWLAGPWDSYLGFWKRGGGASGEHSHAINLWQHFAHLCGGGRVVEVQAMMDFVRTDKVDYDRLCIMNLRTESGLMGRCVQDVVTQPPRKWARIQSANGSIEWQCGKEPGIDTVTANGPGRIVSEQKVHKTRPDDFIEELRHIEAALASNPLTSPIAMTYGLDTMLVVAAAHMAARTGRSVRIDYSRGYSAAALTAA